MKIDTLIDAASRLTPAERAELVDAILLLDEGNGSDVALTPAQKVDLDRRIDEYEAGKARMIPGDLAFEMLRKRK